MKFLIDMPVTPRAAALLRAEGHEAVHASEVGLGSVSDAEILARARAEGRVVITADLDYPRLLALAQASSPGLVLFRGGNHSDEEMLSLLARVLAANLELESSLVVVDRGRVRRRRLPIGEDPR